MKQHDLTQGNLFQVLLRFSIPFLIANVIQALYGAVDFMVIGWFCSTESVAAVSTGAQVTQIITSVITGLTLGGTVLVGKYVGMKREDEVERTIGTTLTIFVIFSAILTALMLLFAEPVLTALQTPEPSFQLAKEYVVVCSWGIFFICGYNAISAILRGYGDSRSPLMFITISCVVNIIGDVVFVRFFDWGVRGTAAATIFSQGISMVWAVIYLKRKKFVFQFRLRQFKIYRDKAVELAKVGIPISLQECMVRLSFLYLTSVTNQLGIYAAAAVGIASRYDVFAMLPATSTASALAAIVSQNYGARKFDRMQKSLTTGIMLAFPLSFAFFLWAQLSPQTMIGIFSTDPAIVQAGIPFFRSCSFDYLAVLFVFCMNGYLNGRSQTVFTMCSCCFGALALRMPLIRLVYAHAADNLLLIGAVAPTVSGIMALYTFFYLKRQFRMDRKQLEKQASGEAV